MDQNDAQVRPNINSDQIKEEFYKWFENKGLLSDLRAYMRQKMVKALEDSNKNGQTSQKMKASTSPKLQAINLLLIDYLFHEDYLYTVSVFASEARILESLPQYSCYVTQTVKDHHWNPCSLPRFSPRETEDILDTLRLPPTHQEIQRAIGLYLSGHESLLTCVVRTLASSSSSHNHCISQEHFRSEPPDVDVKDDTIDLKYTYQLWSQEMQDLLLLAGVKLQHIRRMQYRWSQIIEEEKLKAKKELEDEYTSQQVEWQQRTVERLHAELKEQLQGEQQLLREHHSRVELKERDLASLAEQLAVVHEDISERLSQLQLQSEELQEKEALQKSTNKQLEERFSQVKIKEDYIRIRMASIRRQNTAHEEEENLLLQTSNLENRERLRDSTEVDGYDKEYTTSVAMSSQTAEPVVTVYTQTLSTEDHEQQTSLCDQQDQQLLVQLQMGRDKINELLEENLELRTRVLQQRRRIDELTNRAASLSSQLEESRISVAVLSGQESGVVVAQPTPPAPLTPAFIAPTFGFNSPQRIGAGEESLFAPRPQQTPLRPDDRKRPLRFAFSQNLTPTSEESSPTDEIIQNARTRINQLEDESAAIQRNYQEFQTRLLTSDSVMFPSLNNPYRIRNPVMRVRRNDFVPIITYPHAPYPPPSQSRPTQSQVEDNEDSSSDQASLFYNSARIESLTNSRRLFTQRNLRQFERWKQFKKKFHRRDSWDHRRNVHFANSNTSSDDDESNSRNARKRKETSKVKKAHDIEQSNGDVHETYNSCSKIEKPIKPGSSHISSANVATKENIKEKKDQSTLLNTSDLRETDEASVSIGKTTTTRAEDKMKLKEDKSIKLIESAKMLLATQVIVNQDTSMISNEGLTVDSLHREYQNTQRETNIIDNSSALTLCNIQKPSSFQEETTVNLLMTECPEKHILSGNTVQITSIKHAHSINGDKEREVLDNEPLEINQALPLAIPTFSLVSPELNLHNEDCISFPPLDVAEDDGGDQGTTSITSGSDILHELNPSKSNSSDSVLSTGIVEYSKHSSDFWN